MDNTNLSSHKTSKNYYPGYKKRHDNKLKALWLKQRIKTPESVKNLSNRKLSLCELEALRFGLKHHILPRNLNCMYFKLSIEKGFYFVNKEIKGNFQVKENIKHACDSFINSASNVFNSFRHSKLHKTLKRLSIESKI